MRHLRQLLKVFPAIAAALFGLQQIGAYPIAPGLDLGFDWESLTVKGQRVLALSSDSGNMECWIWLRLRCKEAGGITAKLSDETPLEVLTGRTSDGKTWNVEIFKKGGPRQAKFLWASGTKLYLVHDRESMQGAAIEDWEIHTASGKHDSRTREIWRRTWFGLSLVLLAGIVAGTFLKKEAPPRLAPTPERFIAMAIEGMEGSSDEETEKLQTLLKEVVLEGARAEDALVAVAGGNLVLWFKARRQFLDRLDHLLETILFYRRRL